MNSKVFLLSFTDSSMKMDLCQCHKPGFRTQAFKEINPIVLEDFQDDTCSLAMNYLESPTVSASLNTSPPFIFTPHISTVEADY